MAARNLIIVALGALNLSLCLTETLAGWQLREVDGRQYVTLANIAAFYECPPPVAVGEKAAETRAARRSLRVEKDSREAYIDGIKHWLCFPVIAHNGSFLISRMDLGMTIEPAWRPERIRGLSAVKTIVLDPGHGGHDQGAHGPYANEKDFTLDLGRRVRDRLQKRGIHVVMTRHNDVFVPLEKRARIGNRESDSIFVSLHFNASGSNPNARGFEIFCTTPRGAPSSGSGMLRARDMVSEKGNSSDLQSFALASALHHAMIGTMDRFDRGVKRARFAVLRLTEKPSVLVEAGFLSNADDAETIADPDWRNRLADSIVEGLLDYMRLAENHTPFRLAADYRKKVPSGTNAQASAEASPPTPAAPES